MRSSGRSSTRATALSTLSRLGKKLLFLLTAFVFTFSTETQDTDIARSDFFKGYMSLQNRDFSGAIQNFSQAYMRDREGYYGELSYLYLGKSYALLSYYTGRKEGVYSAIAFLNMYPFYYKKNNYLDLQLEFIGDAYILLEMYDKAKDVYFSLYKRTQSPLHLVKFLYASVMLGEKDAELLSTLDPKGLGEEEYIYHLILGYNQFNLGDYASALHELTLARQTYRYLEDDPHFLYRYAISHYMLGDWRRAVFYMELLARRDLYGRYEDYTNYYLTLIYLGTGNYTDALKRVESVLKKGLTSDVYARLLYSQLWAYPDFLEKNKDRFPNYPEELVRMAWIDKNRELSIQAILGIYYLSLKDRRVYEPELLRLKKLSTPMPSEIRFEGLRVNVSPLLLSLRQVYEKIDPYSEDRSRLLKTLYETNRNNFLALFSAEKLARALVYMGDDKALEVIPLVEEPVRSFLMGQMLLLKDDLNGLNMIRASLNNLQGDDRREALFILGIMEKSKDMLESALKDERLPKRLGAYLQPALFELADWYYSRKDYVKAKELYKRLIEMSSEEDPFYWICAFRLAYSSSLTGDTQTLRWVVKKVEKKDNIISRVIVELWG